jgi:hypothetical protein
MATPLLPLLLLFSAVQAQVLRNVSIDDTNTTAIQYAPTTCAGGVNEWGTREGTNCYNGTLRVCDQLGATAIFEFTGKDPLAAYPFGTVYHWLTLLLAGVAIYLLYPLWPYPMTLVATLDSSEGVSINLTDPNAARDPASNPTALWHSVWSATGLENVQHRLVLSNGRGHDSFDWLHADGFMCVPLAYGDLQQSASEPPTHAVTLHKLLSLPLSLPHHRCPPII